MPNPKRMVILMLLIVEGLVDVAATGGNGRDVDSFWDVGNGGGLWSSASLLSGETLFTYHFSQSSISPPSRVKLRSYWKLREIWVLGSFSKLLPGAVAGNGCVVGRRELGFGF